MTQRWGQQPRVISREEGWAVGKKLRALEKKLPLKHVRPKA